MSNVEALNIVGNSGLGMGQPSLNFSGSGLLLVSTHNNASLMLSNLKLYDCSGYHGCISQGDDNTHYLLNFTMSNVLFNKTTHDNLITLRFVAKSVYCQSSQFTAHALFVHVASVVDTAVLVLNSTFESGGGISIYTGILDSGLLHNTSTILVLIKQCHFVYLTSHAIKFDIIKNNYFVNFTVQECVINNSTPKYNIISIVNNFFDIVNNYFDASIDGIILIVNNFFISNTCHQHNGCIEARIKRHLSSQSIACDNHIEIKITNNIFIQNAGEVFMFKNWPFIAIINAEFINNTAPSYLILVQYDIKSIQCFFSSSNLSFHNLTFSKNSVSNSLKGAIASVQVLSEFVGLGH